MLCIGNVSSVLEPGVFPAGRKAASVGLRGRYAWQFLMENPSAGHAPWHGPVQCGV